MLVNLFCDVALPTWSKVTFFVAISTPVPPKLIFSRILVMVQAQTLVSCIVKDFASEAMAYTLLDSGNGSRLILESVGWILTNFLVLFCCSDGTVIKETS